MINKFILAIKVIADQKQEIMDLWKTVAELQNKQIN